MRRMFSLRLIPISVLDGEIEGEMGDVLETVPVYHYREHVCSISHVQFLQSLLEFIQREMVDATVEG